MKECQTNMPALCQEYMRFFCLPSSNQPRLNTQQQGRAQPVWRPPPPTCAPLLLCVQPWLITQWQAEDGHIWLTCLQLVGTWVHN